MFARVERRSGTPPYLEYYARRPERKQVDDALRELPPLMSPGGRYYHAEICSDAEEYFDRIDGIEVDDYFEE